MINTIEALAERVGKTVVIGEEMYIRVKNEQWTEHIVKSYDGKKFIIYNQKWKGTYEIEVEDFDVYIRNYRIFDTKEEGQAYEKNLEEETIKNFVDEFGSDKEAFLIEMIKGAYAWEAYGEWVDENKALAIKTVAEMYYPTIKLDE